MRKADGSVKSVKERITEHAAQGIPYLGTPFPTPKIDQDFIAVMQACADKGCGFGFMQQVIEWEWQHRTNGLGVWGPEYFNELLAMKDQEIAKLKAEIRALQKPKKKTNGRRSR